MNTESWDEFRTAFQVARLGTVSAASEALGVHHATVIRHIDALEARLGVKLFQRHARGYSATEAGEDLLQVATVTEDQLNQLVGRIRGRSNSVTGELVITTVPGISESIIPALSRFQSGNCDLKIRLISDSRLFRLEYGEAHVAIRVGAKPQEPDNVVQLLAEIEPKLCAAQSYVAKYGLPKTLSEFADHRFVGSEAPILKVPHVKWMQDHVPDQNIVFRTTELRSQEAAVAAGAGIGFVYNLSRHMQPDLAVVFEDCDAWRSKLWLVTHVDLHRTAKVQAILKFLKEEAKGWGLAENATGRGARIRPQSVAGRHPDI